MNRSTPGLPVHHKLLEFTQTHVHRVSDSDLILSSPSPGVMVIFVNASLSALAVITLRPGIEQVLSETSECGWH